MNTYLIPRLEDYDKMYKTEFFNIDKIKAFIDGLGEFNIKVSDKEYQNLLKENDGLH